MSFKGNYLLQIISFVQILVGVLRRFAFIFGLILLTSFANAQTPDSSETVAGVDSTVVDSTAMASEPIAEETPTDISGLVPPEELNDSIFTELVQNLIARGKDEALEVSWSIDYEWLEAHKDQQIIVRYGSSIEAKQIKEEISGVSWHYSDPLPITTTNYTIEGLGGNTKYKVWLGFAPKGNIAAAKDDKKQMVYTKHKIEERTKRSWGVMKFLMLIGSLGLFIFGMKIMSDGMQRAAGNRLRSMLGSMTSNRFKGILTGVGSTAIVQSSSVTTVMTVSLVNAGLLTLRQSVGIMMGANVGTTITAWLVLLLGFKVSVSDYALVILAIGAPMLFMAFRRSKDIANTIIGFAILFIGLEFLKQSVPDLDKDSGLVQFFLDYKDIPVLSNILFVGLGTLVTIVIQSSSAAMALTLTLVSKGIIPFEVACAMVLGENIGTTITASIAATIGNVYAKRAARIHLMINVVGVVWMLIVFSLFLSMIGWLVSLSAGTAFDPLNPEMAGDGIALFHTIFNAVNVLLLVWFVPQLVRLAERSVRSKGENDEEFKLDYITGGVVDAPEVAILESKKEVAKFGRITSKMSGFLRTLLNEQDKKVRNKMFKKLAKYEEITDRVEIEIANFLEKITANQMTPEASMRVRSMLSITNDLERIGDIFYQMSKTIERKDDEKLYFLPDQRNNLNEMLDLVDKAFEKMNENLNAEYGNIDTEEARKAEVEINEYRNKLRHQYLENVQSGEYNIQGGMVYNDLFSSLEKVGDHVINVSEAVEGTV